MRPLHLIFVPLYLMATPPSWTISHTYSLLQYVLEEGRVGLQITSQDSGPVIANVEQALTDGFSTVR